MKITLQEKLKATKEHVDGKLTMDTVVSLFAVLEQIKG